MGLHPHPAHPLRPDAERAARQDAERARVKREADLRVAAGVRQLFLTQQYGTARGAKKVYLDALRAAVTDPRSLDDHDQTSDLLDSLAGVALHNPAVDPAVATAGLDRLTRMLVARWVAAEEQNLLNTIDGRVWGSRPEAALAYLDRLTTAGYTLSDAEQHLHSELTTTLAELDDEDDEHEDDDSESDTGSEVEFGTDDVADEAADEAADEQDEGDGRAVADASGSSSAAVGAVD